MVSTTDILQGPLAALREAEIDLLTDINATLAEIGDGTEEERRQLSDMVKDLRDLFFLVVIIGEFNTGKSTFVNALLEDDLLPTGITPTTEVIELIHYADEPLRKPIVRDGSLREWAHPNTGAPGVAIVDTPGTGSVFQRHEDTARSFLHRSDLVIFLISAKRALAETERFYLEMAKNYGKKIILVINQIDLLQPGEQSQVRRFIEGQVKEQLGLKPLLFMVSAKEAVESRKNPGAVSGDGGISAVRAHLRGVFAEASPAKQKLLAQLDTAMQIVDRHYETIRSKTDLVKTDTSKVREVQQELQQQSLGLDAQLLEARAEVDKVFDGMRQRGLNFIDTNLSIRKFGRTLNRDRLQAEFQDVVVGRALRDINEATAGYINTVIDQSRVYWRGVIERLSQLQDLLEQELGGVDANIYAEQRESLQEAIRIAEAELKTYSSGRMVEEIRQEFQASMNGFAWSTVFSLGGLLVTLLATVGTPGPLIGAGAAALALPVFLVAAPAAALGSVYALRYYRRITSDLKRDFNQRVDRLMEAYHTALDDLTRKERNRLTQYGSQVLMPVFSRLEVLMQRYSQQKSAFETYRERSETLRRNIQESS